MPKREKINFSRSMHLHGRRKMTLRKKIKVDGRVKEAGKINGRETRDEVARMRKRTIIESPFPHRNVHPRCQCFD